MGRISDLIKVVINVEPSDVLCYTYNIYPFYLFDMKMNKYIHFNMCIITPY